jgi:hypothetical protein
VGNAWHSSQPVNGSICVFSPSSGIGSLGHVAFVEETYGPYFLVSQANWASGSLWFDFNNNRAWPIYLCWFEMDLAHPGYVINLQTGLRYPIRGFLVPF